MNNTAVIPPYTHHNFSSRKFYFWGRLQRFILVNPLPFTFNIIIKDPFFYLERRLVSGISDLPYTFHEEYKEFKHSVCSLFLPFSIAGRLWIGMHWDEMLIFKYFCVNCISLILLEHLDLSLMNILVWVSSLNDISSKWNFENHFKTRQSVMSPWL